MGATISHLVVFNFNLNNKEGYAASESYDSELLTPLKKAEEDYSYEQVLEKSKWTNGDAIVQIVCSPLVMKPVGYVLPKNDNLKVTLECSQCDEDGISISSFTVTNSETYEAIEYNVDDFGKPVYMEEEVNDELFEGQSDEESDSDIDSPKSDTESSTD
jgi:predicted Zn-ribbon and HTH transcriptional regulator